MCILFSHFFHSFFLHFSRWVLFHVIAAERWRDSLSRERTFFNLYSCVLSIYFLCLQTSGRSPSFLSSLFCSLHFYVDDRNTSYWIAPRFFFVLRMIMHQFGMAHFLRILMHQGPEFLSLQSSCKIYRFISMLSILSRGLKTYIRGH